VEQFSRTRRGRRPDHSADPALLHETGDQRYRSRHDNLSSAWTPGPGHLCVNDVTAIEFLFEDKAFQQWTRSKGFDTFTPLGPCINTDIDPAELNILAIQNGETRQDYPVRDMIYSPQQIVSMISGYQTLVPGDLICCGTSVGARTMKPGSDIHVSIPGIGTLVNQFDDLPA
jgi:2-keto-4-pentenoate hydratase/2-oxohepta-3-ene-1,7-dioic acid hydratase in catechol pathway